jgi:hypothetical protein
MSLALEFLRELAASERRDRLPAHDSRAVLQPIQPLMVQRDDRRLDTKMTIADVSSRPCSPVSNNSI